MLGAKKTIPLWRRRRASFLELERALVPSRRDHHSDTEYAVIAQKLASRRAEAVKGKVGHKG